MIKRIVIAGSRDYNNYDEAKSKAARLPFIAIKQAVNIKTKIAKKGHIKG